MLAQSLPQPSKLGVGASPSKTFRSATQCVPTVPGQFAAPLAHANLSSGLPAPVQVATGKKTSNPPAMASSRPLGSRGSGRGNKSEAVADGVHLSPVER